MKDYIQVTFFSLQPEQIEILVARLSDADYEGFEESGEDLKAFIPAENFQEELLNEIVYKYQLHFIKEIIPAANWNQLWESGFHPVTIDDFCTIRAEFHEAQKNTQYEIIITPKLSFGTGHHSTTYMMIEQMRSIDFRNKTALDFGTGTGILAILAEKLGAKNVFAVDNDDWSIENAGENIEKNHCSAITVLKSDKIPVSSKFDIILANINKNVILEHASAMVKQLPFDGVIILSGLLTEDEAAVHDELKKLGLKKVNRLEKNNWISLRMEY